MTEPQEPRGVVPVPASTAAPLYAALGVTLLAASLVTHPLAAFAGVGFFVGGMIGWLRELLPHEHKEAEAMAAAPAPIRARMRPVQHRPETPHRARLPLEVYPISAGIRGGIGGGVAMAVLAMLYGVAAHGSPWYPVNLLAAVAMPHLAAASHETLLAFNPGAFGLAIVIHGIVSLLVGLMYGALLPMLPWHPPVTGGIVAPLAWSALLAATLRAINPTLNARVDWPWFIVTQVAFGLVAGAMVMRARKVPTSR
jgi:hypothetical protein